MTPPTPDISGISRAAEIRQQKIQALNRLSAMRLMQISSKKAFLDWCESGFNPVAITRRFRPIDELKMRKREKVGTSREFTEEDLIIEPQAIEETSNYFQERNPELEKEKLLSLLKLLSKEDTVEDLLSKIFTFFPDPTLADEALDFLIETTRGPLKEKLMQAKVTLNISKQREIIAGKNISEVAREFAEEGKRTPTDLRQMYREVTGQAKPPQMLFNELYEHFTYQQIEQVINFLFHALGRDLKSKGPSIEPGELYRLIDETKTLQAILGVYRFFESRMNLIHHQFDLYGINWPIKLTFEFLAKQFMDLINQRYLSLEKALIFSKLLGLEQTLLAQIVILMQMRDGLRNTAPKLYKSKKNRQEILDNLMEFLEELEEKEENEEEEKAKEKKEKKRK